MSVLVIIFCALIILFGLVIFIGVIVNASKGRSNCDNCRKCKEEFCSQRKEENPDINK